jgi:hypothetical protein
MACSRVTFAFILFNNTVSVLGGIRSNYSIIYSHCVVNNYDYKASASNGFGRMRKEAIFP